MLRKLLRASAILALLFTCFTSTGCSWRLLHVMISDFDGSALNGVSIFRIAQDSGQAEPAGHLEFISVDLQNVGGVDYEVLQYRIVEQDGTRFTESSFAELVRDTADPETVELQLVFQPTSPGFYKVSTFNDAGSSPLSANQVQLF